MRKRKLKEEEKIRHISNPSRIVIIFRTVARGAIPRLTLGLRAAWRSLKFISLPLASTLQKPESRQFQTVYELMELGDLYIPLLFGIQHYDGPLCIPKSSKTEFWKKSFCHVPGEDQPKQMLCTL